MEQYGKLLDVPHGRNLPEVLLQVMVWVLGEYGTLLAASTAGRPLAPHQVSTRATSRERRRRTLALACSDQPRALCSALGVAGASGTVTDALLLFLLLLRAVWVGRSRSSCPSWFHW